MHRLIDDITAFLESYGFNCSRQIRWDYDVICTTAASGVRKTILPIEISSANPEDAAKAGMEIQDCIMFIKSTEGYPLIITEDRWKNRKKMMQSRVLAHLEVFGTVYARNCEIRRIEKEEAQGFLRQHHSYGYAACKYRYGMFLRRNTGNLCSTNGIEPDTLVAVATFSNARRWIKSDQEIRSYEWIRYASLPHLRISGGMGKMLKTFIKEVNPDDIMTYADMEWSEGNVYRDLGFSLEGEKEPVTFCIETDMWTRTPIGKTASIQGESCNKELYFSNFGSKKYRMKLTDYK